MKPRMNEGGKMLSLTDHILKWYDDVPKDLQEQISWTLHFYLPDDFDAEKRVKPIKDIYKEFRSFIKREGLHLFAYIGHVIYCKALIDFFFMDKGTQEDWENIGNDFLDELDRIQSDDYRQEMKANMPENFIPHFEEHNTMRIDAIKRYLKNYDKDSTTYVTCYEEWMELCKNEISKKAIKKYEDRAFNNSLFNK